MSRRNFFKKIFIAAPALALPVLPVQVNSEIDEGGFEEYRALAFWEKKLNKEIASRVVASLYAQLVLANGVSPGTPVALCYVPQDQKSKEDPLGQRGYFGVITKEKWPEPDPKATIDDDYRLLKSEFMKWWKA